MMHWDKESCLNCALKDAENARLKTKAAALEEVVEMLSAYEEFYDAWEWYKQTNGTTWNDIGIGEMGKFRQAAADELGKIYTHSRDEITRLCTKIRNERLTLAKLKEMGL